MTVSSRTAHTGPFACSLADIADATLADRYRDPDLIPDITPFLKS